MSRDNTMRGAPAPAPLRQAYVKGTDIRIVGMSETVAGTTGVVGFEPDGEPIFDDEGTQVCWDATEPCKDAQGRVLYCGSDHRTYTLDQCEWRDAAKPSVLDDIMTVKLTRNQCVRLLALTSGKPEWQDIRAEIGAAADRFAAEVAS